MQQEATTNPYQQILTEVTIGKKQYSYFDLNKLNDPRVKSLPVSVKVLLECAVRNCNGFNFTKNDVEQILNWEISSKNNVTYRYITD